MISSPTTGAQEPTSAWAGRPAVARGLRVLVALLPIVASWVVTRLLASTYWRPDGTIGLAVWGAQMLVVGSVVVLLTGRVARRLLPLAALFNLTLAFPDQAPSRFRIALRSGTIRNLEAEIADVRAHGFGDTRAEVAARVVELVTALGRHERLTRGHTERVRAYTDMIAVEMGLSTEDREKLRWAALLHDIGKLAVPAEILNKPGKPTAEEWAVLQSHPAVGGEMVEQLADWLGPWRLAASQHHERWDGKGYPNQLVGAEISLAGRIVAVADAYDVITSARTYKKPMSADAARQELVRCSGAQFDPAVVRAFLAVSLGRRGARIGALGWAAELVRNLVGMAAQGASSATTIVAATAVASATAVGAMNVPLDAPMALPAFAAPAVTPVLEATPASAGVEDVPVRAARAGSGRTGGAVGTDGEDLAGVAAAGASPNTSTTVAAGGSSASAGSSGRGATGATGGTGASSTTSSTTTSTTVAPKAAPGVATPSTSTTAPASSTTTVAPGGTSTGTGGRRARTSGTNTTSFAPSGGGTSAPVAVDDAATVARGGTVTIAVLANDHDADGDLDPATLTVVRQPTRGTVTVDNGRLVYVASNASGSDRVDYRICDAGGRCATARVDVRRG